MKKRRRISDPGNSIPVLPDATLVQSFHLRDSRETPALSLLHVTKVKKAFCLIERNMKRNLQSSKFEFEDNDSTGTENFVILYFPHSYQD